MTWIIAQGLQQSPLGQSLSRVQPEQFNCNASHFGKRFDLFSTDSEMIEPPVSPWMEEPNNFPGTGVN